jgi:hypothetical protein
MITVLGTGQRFCDGVTRRESLRIGALSALGGFGLPQLLRAEAQSAARLPLGKTPPGNRQPGKAKNVIIVFLAGGAASQDMYDMKPDAPADIRGEFKPIATSLPGLDICEHLPRLAEWMHKAALIRSLNHQAGCHNALPMFTGYDKFVSDFSLKDTYPPCVGSVCEYLKRPDDDLPAYFYLPHYFGWGQTLHGPGPYAGFLGKRYDPFISESRPYLAPGTKQGGYPGYLFLGEPTIGDAVLSRGMTLDRLDSRRTLLQQLDGQLRRADATLAQASFDRTQQRAFSLLTSSKLKSAFDLSRVNPKVRDRYGRTLFGNSSLIARQLLESGVRLVTVAWEWYLGYVKDDRGWDTHENNFNILRNVLLPNFDQTLSALIEDLAHRGLLDETLVAVMSDFGRTPRINGAAGRDHWTYCYSALLFGAGIKAGTICGASDAQGAFVKDRPIRPADFCATLYECLGIDPNRLVHDQNGRPYPVAQGGEPIREILA